MTHPAAAALSVEPPKGCAAVPVTVMSWNILEGFHTPRSPDPRVRQTVDPARLAAARDVLAHHQPDVLILNEALWAVAHEGYAMDYAAALGYAHGVGDLYDGCWGNMILSRYPLLSHDPFRIYNRSGVRVTVQADGWLLDVATYHPHPDRRPFKKAEDFAQLLAGHTSDRPCLIGGDFNAISPADEPDLARLTAAFARFAHDPRHSASRFIESGQAIFPVLAQHGFRDALAPENRRYSMPTDLISADKASAMRIDHLWVNHAIDVRDAQVLQTDATNRASDHHPLWACVEPAA